MIFRLFLLLFCLAAASVAVAALDYFAYLEKPVNLPANGGTFVIENGWTARRVSQKLIDEGIIDNRHWFDLHARLENKAGKIKSGEFTLEAGLTPPQLLDVFLHGQSRQYSFGIIEGSTYVQVWERLAQAEHLSHTIADLSPEQIMEKIGKPGQHPEGMFLSETFQFPRNTTDIAFLKRAADALDKVLLEEWEARAPDLPLATPYEALILASIVEKETAVVEERPLIAGVFLSRLNKKMRLQTDPTVIYGIGPNFDGNIRRADLRRDTPYNTYTRAGLPPTPIAMVGREAIHAVLHPTATKSLYFVAKGDGTHQFSETVEQHNEAVRVYQLKRPKKK